MTLHPDETRLLGWLDGEAADGWPDLVDHLAGCDTCQARLAALADETAWLRSAVALTPAELHRCFQADLPGRLVRAVCSVSYPALRHLAILFGLSLAIAAAWAVIGPVAEPALVWIGRLADVTTLSSLAAVRGLIFAVGILFESPVLLVGQLVDELLMLIAGVLLAGLWRYRLGTPTPRPSMA